MSERSRVEQGIAALRAGRSVQVGGLVVIAVETASAAAMALIDPSGEARLLISGARAAALSLGNAIDAADPEQPVLLARDPWLDRATALALIDPARDLARGPTGPLQPMALPDPAAAAAALMLARDAGLLPALWLLDKGLEAAVALKAEDLERHGNAVHMVARAALPIADLPDSQIVAFRAERDGQEHVALVIGAFGGRPPLVRLHSECLTGDVFGSLKCDCGPQLHEALALIGKAGGGVLLYMRQEGRGIGLANKIRAYALQDRGLDTVDANRRLGFADDVRGYGEAAAMLRALGIESVRLLTNNPAKVAGLEAAGIAVIERVGHNMTANPHNADYLATKRGRSGHLA